MDKNRKPKARKVADKKVVFDWNAGDDTSALEQGTWSQQIIGQGPGGTTFGGRLAGLDEGGSRRGAAIAANDQCVDCFADDMRLTPTDMQILLNAEELAGRVSTSATGRTSHWTKCVTATGVSSEKTSVLRLRVERSHTQCATGRSLASHQLSFRSLMRSVTKSPVPFNARLSLSA
jgi:hypothetical protein